jgi:hypothetical protein
MGSIFLLDWNRDLLYGFQSYCCDESVEALRVAIRRNEKICPVVVMDPFGSIPLREDGAPEYLEQGLGEPFDPELGKTYLLDNRAAIHVRTSSGMEMRRNGGHHRAWAHYLEGKPLPCRWRYSGEDLYPDHQPSHPMWRLLWEVPRKTGVLLGDGKLEWELRREQHGYKCASK